MERRIVRTCLNKNYQVDGVWRLASNETVYKNIEPITSIIKKKRISFLGHLLRTPENRISRKIVEKLWYSKSDIKWITELREDMRELQITVEDLKHKTNTLKILNDKHSTLQLKRNKQRIGRVVPEEERKLRSERMKKYWVDKRRKTRKYKFVATFSLLLTWVFVCHCSGRYSASECLCHPWLARRPPLLTTGLDITKENLRETVERWNEQDPSPTQVTVIPLPPTPPATPVMTQPPPPPPAEVVTPPDITAAIDNSPKGVKNPGDLQSPNPSKQPKIEIASVKSKDIENTAPEETKVSTFSWTKKTPTVKSQMSLPEGKPVNKTKMEEDSKNVNDGKFPSKFSLKPSSSIANTGSLFNSRIQQGGTQITISKKSLNPSPQPKIAGIVLGQTHPRGPDLFPSKKELPKSTVEKAPPEPKPKIITHKIIVEGKDITEEPTADVTKASSKISSPINIDNKDSLHPLLRNLQSDRFERRCSDISCFLHDIENSTDGSSILSEIKKLSTRLFESDMLDESNNNRSTSLLRQIANRGVGPRRPKFRVTNLNRDVPIGSPPPPTNMTYFIPPNSLSPESYSSQTHSAPQSPRGSPDRIPETLTKDVILRLFDKLEGHSECSAVESVTNYVRSSETKKKVTSISTK
ncbi:hypothetical protein J6590_064712 [Homalodisca vitripennis]|nr:hypothetical protein J6590_064712 [Homalodisca vitripennis]